MQIRGLHRNIYKAASMGLSIEINSQQAEDRRKVLGDWELLKKRGLPDHEIHRITGISRSTYYRRKNRLKVYGVQGLNNFSKRPKRTRQSDVPQRVIDLILAIRKDNPTYGKHKIRRILFRDHGVTYSESTVGRILDGLMEQGKIKKYAALTKIRKRRKFTNHAQKWQYGMKAAEPGELIQIDHMSVHKDGLNMKHFQAWDPKSKVIVADVYTNANSSSAAKFLEKVLKEMPFTTKSIQVDGGSEFMKEFEQRCKERSIPLFVLPPKRPQWNGGVERGNRTFREDFYASDRFIPGSIGEVRRQLGIAQLKYNSYRPHQRLGGLTPFEYVSNLKEVSSVSHVMN
jgi:putative transposase